VVVALRSSSTRWHWGAIVVTVAMLVLAVLGLSSRWCW